MYPWILALIIPNRTIAEVICKVINLCDVEKLSPLPCARIIAKRVRSHAFIQLHSCGMHKGTHAPISNAPCLRAPLCVLG